MTQNNSPKYAHYCKPFSVPFQLLVILLLAALVGCVPTVKEAGEQAAEVGNEHDAVNTARLSFFLNLKDPDSPGVRLELTDLEVLAGQVWLPVAKGPLRLDSEKIAASQVFLGARFVPPGNYERLRFTVTKSSFRLGSGKYTTVSTDPYFVELALSSPDSLAKDDSQCLFVIWDVRRSLEGEQGLHLVMALVPPLRQLFDDLVYVACPDINTIFVIRCDKGWVADSFGVTGGPTYIAMDPDNSERRLYVLASRESRIKLVDLNSQRIIDSYSIPLATKPSRMAINPDGKSVYILDKGEDYLSRLDLASGRLLARLRLGFEPQYMTYLTAGNVVAVSSVITQTVTFHDPFTLQQAGSITTGSSPDGLLLANNQLYIAENGADAVSIFDFGSTLMRSRLNVGLGPRRLFDNDQWIYVSNFDGGSLSVIYPGQFLVSRQIRGLGHPLEMISDQTYRRLYVGDEKEAGLAVIDSNINQLVGYIIFGARPLGLAVIQ